MNTIMILYQFISSPLKTIEQYKQNKPQNAVYLSILLTSLTLTISIIIPQSISTLFIAILGTIVAISLYLFISSAIFDFIAQLFSLPSNSMYLFQWLALTLLPLTLTIPIELISSIMPQTSIITTQIQFIIFGTIIWLQIHTIKTLYNTSYTKSILIFSLPVLTIFIVGLTLLTLSGFLLLTSLIS